MLSNKQERDEDMENMPDSFQNHLLWFLMQSLRHRRRGEDEDDDDDSSTDISTTSNDSFDPDDSDYEQMRCIQS